MFIRTDWFLTVITNFSRFFLKQLKNMIAFLWKETFMTLLNNLVKFSINLFFFQNVNGCVDTTNECMYEFNVWSKMQWNTHFQTFPKWDHFSLIWSFHLHQTWTKALSLDTWILSLINKNYMGIWTNSGP